MNPYTREYRKLGTGAKLFGVLAALSFLLFIAAIVLAFL